MTVSSVILLLSQMPKKQKTTLKFLRSFYCLFTWVKTSGGKNFVTLVPVQPNKVLLNVVYCDKCHTITVKGNCTIKSDMF